PNAGSVSNLVDQIGGLIVGQLNSYGFRTVPTTAYYRWRYLATYFQDDFKVNKKLTLNLGVRWDLETPRTEKFDRQGSFNPFLAGAVSGQPVKGAFVFSNSNGLVRSLWPISYRGWQPRAGVAYAAPPWLTWRALYNRL